MCVCVCVCVKPHVSIKVFNDWTQLEVVQMPWPILLEIHFHLNVVSLSSYGLDSLRFIVCGSQSLNI